MGLFTSLDVVNDMLGLLGEAPVNQLDEEHPLIARGLSYLRTANAREQGRGWWFNTERVDLVPTAEGEIIVPSDVLQLDPVQTSLNYSMRGGRLYNMEARGQNPYKFTGKVDCAIIRLLEFTDLPTQAQILVSSSAQLDFAGMDGDRDKLNELRLTKREALVLLTAEHIRARDANLLNNPSFLATFGGLRGSPAGSTLRHR